MSTLNELGLGRLEGQPRQFWLAVGGVGLATIGCLAPWVGSVEAASYYGFQGDQGKFFILALLGVGTLLWRYAATRRPPGLLLAALVGFLLMVAAGLEFESIRGYDEQIADFGAEYGGSGDSLSALDSWGLLLVILGSLGVTVGAGLLVLERLGDRRPVSRPDGG